MKRHYIYFTLLPLMLFLAMLLPFIIDTMDQVRYPINTFNAGGYFWIIYSLVGILATILLLIRNHVTAMLGSFFFFIGMVLSLYITYRLHFWLVYYDLGIGSYVISLIMITGTVLGIVQTSKLIKQRRTNPLDSVDILDNSL